jgi:ribosomal protein S18 acetylase RimI-like enzyme
MNLIIRPFTNSDHNELITLTFLAFEPIFISFEKILGPGIYPILYPDWRRRQQDGVENIIQNNKIDLWVAETDEKVVGYIACEFYDDATAEVQLLAVHPEYQNQGIGTRLNSFVLQKMKERGMKLAVVSTGGDESHAPARRTYEKAGYTALPLVKYYQDL